MTSGEFENEPSLSVRFWFLSFSRRLNRTGPAPRGLAGLLAAETRWVRVRPVTCTSSSPPLPSSGFLSHMFNKSMKDNNKKTETERQEITNPDSDEQVN